MIDAVRIAIEGVAFGIDSFVCVIVSVECGRFRQEKRLAAASLPGVSEPARGGFLFYPPIIRIPSPATRSAK